VDIDVIDQLLIRYSEFVKYWRKNGSIMGLFIRYLYIDSDRKPMIRLGGERSHRLPIKLIGLLKCV
jgi:hypothetical protein